MPLLVGDMRADTRSTLGLCWNATHNKKQTGLLLLDGYGTAHPAC